jgi:UDP-N-acetyl-D-mannosaminuronic acid dehydrogenase
MNEQYSSGDLPKNVTVLGLGQIGLPLVVLAALRSYKVYGVDIDLSRLEKIRVLDEKSIEGTVGFFLQDERVTANLQLSSTIQQSTEFFVICVPTFLDVNKKPVLELVEQCCLSLVPFIKAGATIIIESTVPIGFTRKMGQRLEKETGLILEENLFVAYSPERLFPGQAFKELVFNDRVVGGVGEKSSAKAMDFYIPLIKGSVVTTNAETAELVKITENSHRLVQIAFANQTAELAKSIGIDPFTLISLANRHPRVDIASPGIGVGGDCVPIHPLFLQEAPVGHLPSIIKESLNINEQQEVLVIKDILLAVDQLKTTLKKRKPKVLLLGLTYKANVSDVRNSPAVRIAKKLAREESLSLHVYDPMLDPKQILDLELEGLDSFTEHKKMDLLVFLVAHSKFASLREISLPKGRYVDPIGFLRRCELATPQKEVVHE